LRQTSDDNTAKICDEILRSELAMADWLLENVDSLTREFLTREDETFEEAKR
jgi:ferritin-like metal-binding protein YciE